MIYYVYSIVILNVLTTLTVAKKIVISYSNLLFFL